MTITASIVLYHNDVHELQEAINSCLSSPLINTLYLIDNSATDALKQFGVDNRIHYIHNPKNIGFGAGHNIAIRETVQHSVYHIVVNPDISFKPSAVEALVQLLEKEPAIGLAMPKVYYNNSEVQRLCKLLPTPFNLFGRRFASGTAWARRLDAAYELKHFGYDVLADIPNLSGCFMFIRCAILAKVAGFDERFFLYLEDIDLVRRIGTVARTVFYPGAEVQHSYQKSSYHNRKLMWVHLRSAIQYFNKWGWFFDPERKKRNIATLKEINAKR